MSLKIPLWSFRPLVSVLLVHPNGLGGLVYKWFTYTLPPPPTFLLFRIEQYDSEQENETGVARPHPGAAPNGTPPSAVPTSTFNRSTARAGLGCSLGHHGLLSSHSYHPRP